ncbi:MAG: GNAT family N-acetyltransferase [Epulopiscium sp.]|jgi:GNAT superfamily N-acetyltransferase|nr:GNAT family N-acetyltransferase [Candidatus Epulonipiscium sp.]
MIIRKAVLEDIHVLIKLRMDFLTSYVKLMSESESKILEENLFNYFSKHIPLGDFIAYICEIDDKAVSVAFLTISEKPPNPNFITGKTATVHNVFTYPEYCRRGIASKLLQLLIEEAKSQNVSSIELLATEAGKPLYRRLGFEEPENTYMRMNVLDEEFFFMAESV